MLSPPAREGLFFSALSGSAGQPLTPHQTQVSAVIVTTSTRGETNNRRLTHDGEDDDHHVEHVPADGEVVVPQCEQLEDELGGEGHNEHEVDPVEDVLRLVRLVVRLHHHGDHVEADEDHDGDVKDLLRHEVKHHALESVL